MMKQLPTEPVEPALVTLQHADHTVLGVDMLVSQSLSTADLELAPRVRYVLRGSFLCFHLFLRRQPAPVPRDAAFFNSVRQILSMFDVRVLLTGYGGQIMPLRASLCAAETSDVGSPVAGAVIRVPVDAELGSSITFDASARGHGVAAILGPQGVMVVRGTLAAPLSFAGEACLFYASPAVSGACTIFSPKLKALSVNVFDEDGVPRAPIMLAPLGLTSSCSAAAVSLTTDVLLLADESELIALGSVDDPGGNYGLRWRTPANSFSSCYGMAVSSALGYVFATSFHDNMLHCHRLSDGERVASLPLPLGNPRFVAVDPCSGNIFVSVDGVVCVVRCCPGEDGVGGVVSPTTLVVIMQEVIEAGRATHCRPLCVVPPRIYSVGHPAQAFLVVGDFQSPCMRVLSLPGLAPVCSHRLVGVRIVGLASDPWGSALVVCDATSSEVRTLPWPLPEMAHLWRQ